MHLIYLIILGVYFISLYVLGLRAIKTWVPGFPALLSVAGAFLAGTGIGIPVTYVFSCIFAGARDPILWGTVLSIVGIALLLFFWKTKVPQKQKLSLSDAAVAVLSLAFSSWMMFKTFHGAAGQVFVGSNTIFDSAYLVGLVRSMSWGANIPFVSPYFAGAPVFYHFFFVFWVALLEHSGIPIVWAVNIPAILSFVVLLILIYYLPQLLGKQKPLVGWIAVLLTVTNSSLAFWRIVGKMDIWHLQTYPFAGPFDGSVISIFVTLNNYVNQRHLAFAVAAGLFLYMIAASMSSKDMTVKKSAVLGAAAGLLFLWNMAVFVLTAGLIGFLLILNRQWKPLAAFVAGAFALSVLSIAPMAPYLYRAAMFINTNFISGSYGTNSPQPVWNIGDYLWQNLGILPLVAGLGYFLLAKNVRMAYLPFVVSFFALCMLAAAGKRGFDQKAFSFLIIGINVLAAGAGTWLWTRKNIIAKIGALIAVGTLTISGAVDLMPIKNEFAYPLIDKEPSSVISWIYASTPKDAIFVSYSDMIDPVVLAGRTNFFGFYGNVGWVDRSAVVRRVYSGDTDAVKTSNISYILIPKWQKNDFPYTVDFELLTKKYTTAYEDAKFLILQTGNQRPAITIINPVRGSGLGHETDDLAASLQAQWLVTNAAGVHATWLFQYGALEDTGITGFAKQQMKDDEFGLLFEIDRNYAEKSRVQFRGQGAWYTSDGLFLNSYDRNERIHLIDTAFAKFKEIFGYYPKTVGAWWIGGDSLTYMQEKYGITSAMRAADQFNLDFYSIWGTPWDIPYLSSKENEGMPAATFDQSAKVVILQWAIRDPVRGFTDPLYSLQDYPMKGYAPAYVDYLASVYLQKPLGHFVIGLENGGTSEKFQQYYKTILSKAKELQISGKADIVLARDFAERFLAQKKVFAGRTHFLSTDFGSKDQSFWYISENYRAAILKTNNTVSLVDLRNYADKTEEDFDILPNSQSHLRINEPAIIDSIRFPDSKILIKTTDEPLTIKENDKTVELYAGTAKIASFSPTGCTIGERTFSFIGQKPGIPSLYIIVVLYILYFGINYSYRRNLLLLLPLFLAFPFLINNSTFLFDKKETLVLAGISLFQFPVFATVYITKILPLILLIILPKRHVSYWVYYALTVILYLHVPYFPLDKTTYIPVALIFVGIAAVLTFTTIYIFRKYSLKNILLPCCAVPVILLSLAVAIVYSRSAYALTTYEINALQVMKDKKKTAVYVEEVDYEVRPIYKAVRPLLYANYRLGQIITGRKWEIVMRPESNVLKLSGFEDKLIVIPRHLGSDISEYEIASLDLIKIFDNAQIALFEKNK